MAILLVKASVVLALALGASVCLRRYAARTRHEMWSAAFALMLAVPVLMVVLPATRVHVPGFAAFEHVLERKTPAPLNGATDGARDRAVETATGMAAITANVMSSVPEPPVTATSLTVWPRARPFGVSWTSILLSVWAAGASAAFLMLIMSLVRVRAIAAASADVGEEWMAVSTLIATRLLMRVPPRVVTSSRVSSPMAGGVWRPTVFLPVASRDWTDDRRDVGLTHEIAHLASRDPLRHLLVRAVVACYWFHPLAWLAAHRATIAREQACDEAVIAAGTRPSTYARVLLEMTGAYGADRAPLSALPMAQQSQLEKRLMTILKYSSSGSSSTRAVAPVIALVAITCLVASLRAATPAAVPSAAVVLPSTAAAPPGVSGPEAPRVQSRRSWMDCRRDDDYSSIGITTSRDGARVHTMRTTIEGVSICMVAENVAGPSTTPSQFIQTADHVVLRTTLDGVSHEWEITGNGASGRSTWRVNGREHAIDAAAESWKKNVLALIDAKWAISNLHGEESSLRGEISSVRGEESSLRGEISSLRGHVSSLGGEMSSIRGEESSLRGEISSIEGRASAMRGEISSMEGSLSALNGRRFDASSDARVRLEQRVDEIRKKISDMQRQLSAYNVDARVHAVEQRLQQLGTEKRIGDVQREINEFAADARIAAVQKRIEGLDVDGQVKAIDRKIADLDVARRIPALERDQAEAAARLKAAIRAIK